MIFSFSTPAATNGACRTRNTVRATESAQVEVHGLPPAACRALCGALTIENPVHVDAAHHGRSTFGIPDRLAYFESLPDGRLLIPRGAVRTLQDICQGQGLQLQYSVQTVEAAPVGFRSSSLLSEAQRAAVDQVLNVRIGQLVAPAGSGKTVMGMEVIARRGRPALWITHTKDLASQARECASQVLGLDPCEIGMIGDGKRSIGDGLTIATVQTLARGFPAGLADRIGHVVVDECHHVPALQLSKVLSRIPARYLLGLSATPYRRDRLDKVIGWYVGPVAATVDRSVLSERLILPAVQRIDTHTRVQGNSFTEIVTALVGDCQRNRLICSAVAHAAARGRISLVLTERVEHAELLAAMLGRRVGNVAILHGKRPRAERGQVRARIDAGDVRIVVATGQLVGEGFDCPRLDTLFLATPLSYSGRLTQYLGRISRTAPGKTDALCVDFTDDHPLLWASWSKRRAFYEGGSCVELRGSLRDLSECG